LIALVPVLQMRIAPVNPLFHWLLTTCVHLPLPPLIEELARELDAGVTLERELELGAMLAREDDTAATLELLRELGAAELLVPPL